MGPILPRGIYPFDPSTSSGPVDILAIALMFHFFGIGMIQARMAIVLFTILGVLAIYWFWGAIYGKKAGLFVALGVLAVPKIGNISYLFLGRQVMPEVPAVALVILGLWLIFRAWPQDKWLKGTVPGAVIVGLGLLSKLQVIIGVMPGLFLALFFHSLSKKEDRLKSVVVLGILVAIQFIWQVIGMLGTDPSHRQETVKMYQDALSTLILTPSLGRYLTSGGKFILVFSLLVMIIKLADLLIHWKAGGINRPHALAELTICLSGFISLVWAGFVSIGWSRYLFAGWIFALMLFFAMLWNGLGRLYQKYQPKIISHNPSLLLTGLFAGMVLVVFITNGAGMVASRNAQNDAEQMGAYIQQVVPQDAVIESWEKELDALSGLGRFHHPGIAYEYLADRQIFMQGKSPDVGYDALSVNPDFLVLGPFSDLTKGYPSELVAAHFYLIKQIGPYRLYRRG